MESPDRSSGSVQIQFDRDDAGFTGRIRVDHEPERSFSGRLELMRDLELAYAASRKGATTERTLGLPAAPPRAGATPRIAAGPVSHLGPAVRGTTAVLLRAIGEAAAIGLLTPPMPPKSRR